MVKLSNKKIKYIKRHAPEAAPEKIAGDLRISVRDVERVLGAARGRSRHAIGEAFDRSFYYGLMAVAFLAPFMFRRSTFDFANLPQMAFIQVGVVFFLFLWLVRGVAARRLVIPKSPLHLPLVALVLWSLISLAYAHNTYEGLLTWMHWTASVLMFFLVIGSVTSERDALRFAAVIFASGCLAALLGIAQHLMGIQWVPQVIPPAATFANKNMAVHFVILTLPLALIFILNSETKVLPWILGLLSALMVAFLIYSRTKAGWLALLFECGALSLLLAREYWRSRDLAFWNWNKGLAAICALAVVLLMANLGPKGFQWRFGQIFDQAATIVKSPQAAEDEQNTYASRGLRLAIWLNTIEMIKDRPLIGFGLGNHKVFYPVYYRKAVAEKIFSEASQLSNVHNDYLQTFAELGVIGMLILGWLLLAAIVVVLKLTSGKSSRHVRFFAIGISVSVTGLLVNAFFSFPFQRSVPPFLLMIMLGLLALLRAQDGKAHYEIRHRWPMLGASVIVLVCLVWLIHYHHQGMKCDRHYLNITNLERAANWEGVIAEASLAYAYNPSRVKTLSYMGRAYVESGKHAQAVEALTKVIAAYPNHMNALLNIGVAYGSMGDSKRALEAYDRVLAIKPDYAKVHNNMANIYMKEENLDKALEEFRIASELDPENSVMHFNVGIVEMEKERFAEAAAAFERAVELNPEWDLPHKNLGAVYYQYLARREDGIHHLARALELNPDIRGAEKIRQLIRVSGEAKERVR